MQMINSEINSNDDHFPDAGSSFSPQQMPLDSVHRISLSSAGVLLQVPYLLDSIIFERIR